MSDQSESGSTESKPTALKQLSKLDRRSVLAIGSVGLPFAVSARASATNSIIASQLQCGLGNSSVFLVVSCDEDAWVFQDNPTDSIFNLLNFNGVVADIGSVNPGPVMSSSLFGAPKAIGLGPNDCVGLTALDGNYTLYELSFNSTDNMQSFVNANGGGVSFFGISAEYAYYLNC